MTQDIDAVEDSPPPNSPGAKDRSAFASVVSNAVLMVVGAGLAAGGYFLTRVYAPPRPPGEVTSPSFGGVQPDDFKALAERVDALKKDVAKLADKADARIAPDPAIKDLRDRVEDLGESIVDFPARLEALDKKVETTTRVQEQGATPRLDSLDKRISDLAQVVSAFTDQPAPRAGGAPRAEGDAMDRAVGLFLKGKYSEAKPIFDRLVDPAPDDARIWYFAALTSGFATGDWRGETERLVNIGLTREKAGTPDTAAIDAAFSALTTASGKDWLAGYRKRLAAP